MTMAEILNFKELTEAENEMPANIDGYLEMYDGFSNSIEAAKELFEMLHSVFCQICAEANIEPSIFTLRAEEADAVFARTLQWMFPMPYDEPDDDKDFLLVWTGKDKDYQYRIDVKTPSTETEYGDQAPILSRTLRIDRCGVAETWNPETDSWEEYDGEIC